MARAPAAALLLVALASCASTEGSPDAGTSTQCLPGDCSKEGYECGRVVDPDGTCRICGTCTSPATCAGGGTPYRCGCTPDTCDSLQACGTVTDRCSGAPLVCPDCTAPDSCGGGGVPNKCGRALGPGEACGAANTACGAGYVCCATASANLRACAPAEPGGGCPPLLPDLVIDAAVLKRSLRFETVTFDNASCALTADRCIAATGARRLLRFATQTPNVGTADLVLGSPTSSAEFVFSGCHGHYHYADYILYRLLDSGGREVGRGGKQAFCVEDTLRVGLSSNVSPVRKFDCALGPGKDGIQGIQVGWADLYPPERDCQWVDTTGVPSGRYTLELTLNPNRKFRELRYDNNVVTATIAIP